MKWKPRFCFGIIPFRFRFPVWNSFLLNRSSWVPREWRWGRWKANNWRSTERSKGQSIVWCVTCVIQSSRCECKDVAVMCLWKQNARWKRDAWIWLLRHWRRARHIWQWTVPVCVHSIIVVCWLWCDECAHVKTDKPMDKKQVASLCKALMRNRKLNGLYLRGLNTPPQKRASWVSDVMNGTMFDCPQGIELEGKASNPSQTLSWWAQAWRHLTCAVCWHLTMTLVVMKWLEWWHVVLVCGQTTVLGMLAWKCFVKR